MNIVERSNDADRSRVEAVMETLANLRGQGETLAEVAHDARNMVAALMLYCDLLETPGVLASPYERYGGELRLVAAACRRLVEKLVALDNRMGGSLALGGLPTAGKVTHGRPRPEQRWDPLPPTPIANLAEELLSNMNLISALAGASIPVSLEIAGGGWPVRLSSEDLTRILVNLIKNAVEAMPLGGAVTLRLSEQGCGSGATPTLRLVIEDNGPGVPPEALEQIFAAGYSSHAAGGLAASGARRGLGLSITRSIVESAGGRIFAENRSPSGARIVLELPVRAG